MKKSITMFRSVNHINRLSDKVLPMLNNKVTIINSNRVVPFLSTGYRSAIYQSPRRYFHYSSPRLSSASTINTQDTSESTQPEETCSYDGILNPSPSPTRFNFTKNFPDELKNDFVRSFLVYQDFVTEQEEENLMIEFEKYFKRHVYEKDHWDNAISKFRETEKKFFNKKNEPVIERIRRISFPDTGKDSKCLPYTHVLDLAEDGHIMPHVDSVRFCGDRVAVLSLLSSCVGRFRLEKDREVAVDVVIPRFSLYVMKGASRYDFAHEILKNEESYFDDVHIPKGRRVSIIRRNEP